MFIITLLFFLKNFFLVVKITFGFYVFMLLRATLPRYRIDVLITLCWKYFIPVFSVLLFICTFFGL